MVENKPRLELSVHAIVDFLLRAGDIDDRVYNQETMDLGTKLHAAFQKKQGKDYLSEYLFQEIFERPKGTIVLNGRADGIILGGELPIIDEIKSTVLPLDVFYHEQIAWHLGQAECYALMYCHQEKLDAIKVRLTYLSQKDGTTESHEFTYTLDELEEKVYGYFDSYLDAEEVVLGHIQARNKAAENIAFPFKTFRKGQRELAKYAYGIAKKGGFLFAEAPTGIGKTMSTLYPFVKSFYEGDNRRIFYLTAKGTGMEAASQALDELSLREMELRLSFLKAKDKLCLCPGASCNPDECPFAKGYYNKIAHVIQEALSSKRKFDEGFVKTLAYEYEVCPFELQLDLSLQSDVIVADYNYLFDPLVKLERFFGELADPSHDIALIDEAHNLVERGRAMYSATLSSYSAHQLKRGMKGKEYLPLKRALTKIEKALIEESLLYNEDFHTYGSAPKSVSKAIESLKRANQKFTKETHKSPGKEFWDFFLEANKYAKLVDSYYDSGAKIYLAKDGKYPVLKFFCLDPSKHLKKSLSALKGAVVFSATLSPVPYYMNAILGEEDEPFLLLPSPFPKENFLLMLAPKISTRYKDRLQTMEEVTDYLSSFVSGKIGNYFLYFPSYEYLDKIKPLLHFENAKVLEQKHDMDDEEKAKFLENFQKNPQETTIGLLVLGGAFSEGIDLVDDRLIGVAIVGIGLPQIGPDNDLIREYFEKKNGKGFEYAYMDPGMNKVMQAAGRLIRSEKDVGACLLIDDRYMKEEYRTLFSRIWSEYEVVTDPKDVAILLKDFYKK